MSFGEYRSCPSCPRGPGYKSFRTWWLRSGSLQLLMAHLGQNLPWRSRTATDLQVQTGPAHGLRGMDSDAVVVNRTFMLPPCDLHAPSSHPSCPWPHFAYFVWRTVWTMSPGEASVAGLWGDEAREGAERDISLLFVSPSFTQEMLANCIFISTSPVSESHSSTFISLI